MVLIALATLAIVGVQEVRWWRNRPRVSLAWYRGKELMQGTWPVTFENTSGIPIRSVIVTAHKCGWDDASPDLPGKNKKLIPVVPDGEKTLMMLRNVTGDSWVTVMWDHPLRRTKESEWFPISPTGQAAAKYQRMQADKFEARGRRIPRESRMFAGPDSVLRGSMPRSPRKLRRLRQRFRVGAEGQPNQS